MLMIYGVEFAVIEHIPYIRRFDHGNAGRLEERVNTLNEAVELRNVREDVVCVEDIRPQSFAHELCREFTSEKVCTSGNALLNRNARDVPRRFNTQYRHARRRVVLQEVAVVTRGFDDETLRIQF